MGRISRQNYRACSTACSAIFIDCWKACKFNALVFAVDKAYRCVYISPIRECFFYGFVVVVVVVFIHLGVFCLICEVIQCSGFGNVSVHVRSVLYRHTA